MLAVTVRAPFAAYVPLAWNWLFTLGSAALVYRALRARFGPPAAAVLGCVAVLGLNLVGVAYTGLEHSLQVLLALVAATGVVRAWSDRSRPLPWWFIAALVVGPLVRYEMAAVSTAAVVALWGVRAYRRRLVAATVGWIVPLASFSAFLVALGLDPLPSSVLAKSAYTEGTSPVQVLADKLGHVGTHPSVLAVLAGANWSCAGGGPPSTPTSRSSWARTSPPVSGGRYGRYELYALAAVLPPIARLAADWEPVTEPVGRLAHGLVLALVAVAMVPYAHVTVEIRRPPPASRSSRARRRSSCATTGGNRWRSTTSVRSAGSGASRCSTSGGSPTRTPGSAGWPAGTGCPAWSRATR